MKFNNLTGRLGQVASFAVAGLAVSLAIPVRAIAQMNSPLNPCPKIYYEEPFTRRFLSPQGCPPNVARQMQEGLPMQIGGGVMTLPGRTIQPPLPEQRSEPIAQIAMASGRQVAVRLTNGIASPITYQVLGDTEPRLLMGGASVMLTGLPLPTTITTVREDNGLIDIMAMSSEAGMLEVMLGAEPAFNDTQGVLRIQADGSVYVN